jgi:predicted NUDIX family NTP pyrophosphohydrolase
MEFEEEMRSAVPEGPVVELREKRPPSGKVITNYAIEGDLNISTAHSNTFELEHPKGFGYVQGIRREVIRSA